MIEVCSWSSDKNKCRQKRRKINGPNSWKNRFAQLCTMKVLVVFFLHESYTLFSPARSGTRKNRWGHIEELRIRSFFLLTRLLLKEKEIEDGVRRGLLWRKEVEERWHFLWKNSRKRGVRKMMKWCHFGIFCQFSLPISHSLLHLSFFHFIFRFNFIRPWNKKKKRQKRGWNHRYLNQEAMTLKRMIEKG